MSGIARLVIGMGHKVTGSDVRESSNIAALRELGAHISIGHDEANLGNADTVVVTSALWPNNPEYLKAKSLGLPVLHRSALLAHLASRGNLIAVAGAHGKTTTTGMIITGLFRLGADPSFVNGGVIAEFGASSSFGKGELFVIEADESDSSFLHYDTSVAVITNVDPDHLDHYGSLEAFQGEFAKFANSAKSMVVISADDTGAKAVRSMLTHHNVITFGESNDATVRIFDIDATGPRVAFGLEYQEQKVSLELTIPGSHNAHNAAAAIACLVGLGFDLEQSAKAIQSFAGTERRFELHGERRGVKVYDDFAHHPTEVIAALKAARAVVGNGRLITVFQPRSNTMKLGVMKQALPDSLVDADLVFCYGANLGWDAKEALAPISQKSVVFDDLDAMVKAITKEAKNGDQILVMSNGGFGGIHQKLLTALAH